MKIAEHAVVSFHYRLSDESGAELDSSAGGEPIVYLHGVGAIIPGLEAALAGPEAGDEFEVVLQPDDAYGQVHPELIQTVPHAAFQGIEEVAPGMQFQAQGEDGTTHVVRVVKVEEEGVTIDGNHPLAGEVLHFRIAVQEVRSATPEEIEHGHVH